MGFYLHEGHGTRGRFPHAHICEAAFNQNWLVEWKRGIVLVGLLGVQKFMPIHLQFVEPLKFGLTEESRKGRDEPGAVIGAGSLAKILSPIGANGR